jgi:hypothetical protein
MTDVVLFAFGCLVASMCAAAIGILMQAARQDGAVVAEVAPRRIRVTTQPEPVRVQTTNRRFR